jgi:hypothetical protein
MSRYLFFILALISFHVRAELPAQVTLEYELKKGEMQIAHTKETITQDGRAFKISSEAKAVGALALFNKGGIKRSSEGEITAQGLRPREFKDQRNDKSPNVATFDWRAKIIYLKHDDKVEQESLNSNTLDQLSFSYSFAFGPAKDKELKFAMTDGKRISQYQYNLVGKENVVTPMGDLEALHYSRQRQENERGAEIWFSTQHHLLPIKIVFIEKDGKSLDQIITKITY